MNGVLTKKYQCVIASKNKAFLICQVNTDTHRRKHNDITSCGGTLWLCTSALWAACFHSEDLWVNPGMWRSLEPPSPLWTAYKQKRTDKIIHNINNFKSKMRFWDILLSKYITFYFIFLGKKPYVCVWLSSTNISTFFNQNTFTWKTKWKNSAKCINIKWVYA